MTKDSHYIANQSLMQTRFKAYKNLLQRFEKENKTKIQLFGNTEQLTEQLNKQNNMKPEIKLAIDQIDKMLSTIQDICKEYETTTAPLNLVEGVLEKGSLEIKRSDTKNIKHYKITYNKLLKSIYKACKETCDNMGSSKLPLTTVNNFFKITKENIIEGSK